MHTVHSTQDTALKQQDRYRGFLEQVRRYELSRLPLMFFDACMPPLIRLFSTTPKGAPPPVPDSRGARPSGRCALHTHLHRRRHHRAGRRGGLCKDRDFPDDPGFYSLPCHHSWPRTPDSRRATSSSSSRAARSCAPSATPARAWRPASATRWVSEEGMHAFMLMLSLLPFTQVVESSTDSLSPGPGDYFGEISLLQGDGGRRRATVRATQPTVCMEERTRRHHSRS